MCTMDVVSMAIVTENTHQNWGHKQLKHSPWIQVCRNPVKVNKTSFSSCNLFVQLQLDKYFLKRLCLNRSEGLDQFWSSDLLVTEYKGH